MSDDEMEREMQLLFRSVDAIDEPSNKMIDKEKATKVAAVDETDTFTEAFRKAEAKTHAIPEPDASKKVLRRDGGKVWNDPSLAEWPERDYRIHVRNLPADATDRDLVEAFSKYKSFAKAKVIFDSSGRSRRYGFVSLLDVDDYIDAMKTMTSAFIKSRRVTLTPSKWRDKNIDNA